MNSFIAALKNGFPFDIYNAQGKIFSKKQSVVFISLHKCATSFFSQYVLPNLEGRTLVNFQQLHYQNQLHAANLRVKTRNYGHAYGVVRILDPQHPTYGITEMLLAPKNLAHKKVIFWVRDPRDILVSMYYSFGFTHTLSPNTEIKQYQLRRRQYIQQLTIDEYALRTAPELKAKFERIWALFNGLPTKTRMLLKFEDMIHNFEQFYQQLSSFVELHQGIREEIFKQTRPLEEEHLSQHKRKGKPGDYKTKLKQETIAAINKILAPAITSFGYQTKKTKTDKKTTPFWGEVIIDPQKPPVLVYQMGKVGSKTLANSLYFSGVPYSIYNAHCLSEKGLKEMELQFLRKGITDFPQHFYRFKEISRKVKEHRYGIDWKIITLTRDPIAVIVAAFFENMETNDPDLLENGKVNAEKALETITKRFESVNLSNNYFYNWFDNELKIMFGVDVYRYPYDFERGYSIIEEGNVAVLLLRLEDINRSFHKAVSDFLETDAITIIEKNVGAEKPYAKEYDYVKANMRLPLSVCKKIYSSKYARHFYTTEEIDLFTSTWTKNSRAITHDKPSDADRPGSQRGWKDIKAIDMELESLLYLFPEKNLELLLTGDYAVFFPKSETWKKKLSYFDNTEKKWFKPKAISPQDFINQRERLQGKLPGYGDTRGLTLTICEHLVTNYSPSVLYFDVGAYLGTFSIETALLAKYESIDIQVFCFEPGPMFSILKANIAINNLEHCISPINAAISNVNGPVLYTYKPGRLIGGSIGEPSNITLSQICDSTTIDSFIQQTKDIDLNDKSLLMKIDCQGFEHQVYQGCEKILHDEVPIVLLSEFLCVSFNEHETFYRNFLKQFYILDVKNHVRLQESTLIEYDRLPSFVEELGGTASPWTDLVLIPKRLKNSEVLVEQILTAWKDFDAL